MLVVFQESNKETLSQGLGIVTWYNDFRNEEYHHCVAREKAQEILTCRELGIPYVVISKGTLDDNRVIDTNCNIKSLSADTTLVLRCHPDTRLPSSLSRFPKWITPAEMTTVKNWPSSVCQSEEFFKRHVMTIDRDLMGQLLRDQVLTFPLFVKTVEKTDFHNVVYSQAELSRNLMPVEEARRLVPYKGAELEGLFEDEVVLILRRPDWYCEFREQMIAGRVSVETLDAGLIVSDVMDIERAANHKGEYRAYFINGHLSSISSYLDYEHAEVPKAIREFAEAFGTANAHLAKGFVADFCMTAKGPALIEMNDFCYSGRYFDNDPAALYTDIRRHFGDPAFELIEPSVKVPTMPETEHPDPDRVAVDFGRPAELLLGDDDTLTVKGPEKTSSLVARFERAQALKQSISDDFGLQTVNSLD